MDTSEGLRQHLSLGQGVRGVYGSVGGFEDLKEF